MAALNIKDRALDPPLALTPTLPTNLPSLPRSRSNEVAVRPSMNGIRSRSNSDPNNPVTDTTEADSESKPKRKSRKPKHSRSKSDGVKLQTLVRFVYDLVNFQRTTGREKTNFKKYDLLIFIYLLYSCCKRFINAFLDRDNQKKQATV